MDLDDAEIAIQNGINKLHQMEYYDPQDVQIAVHDAVKEFEKAQQALRDVRGQ